MKTQDLNVRLNNLAQRIAAIKEHRDFETQYHDGHKRTLNEVARHQKELHEKVQKNMHDYEEAHGHLNFLEEQMIIFAYTLKKN